MAEQAPIYLSKALESLEGAKSEYINRRYNNCANRCYYSCFQAAVHALEQAGVTSSGNLPTWSHKGLQSAFVNQFIRRHKVYPSELRSVLQLNYELRQAADYSDDVVSEVQAIRAVRRSQAFIEAVQEQGGGPS